MNTKSILAQLRKNAGLIAILGMVLPLSSCTPIQSPELPPLPQSCDEVPSRHDFFYEPYLKVAQRVPAFGGLFFTLERLKIPRDAVVIEMPAEVSVGEAVPLTLKIKNISAQSIVLGHAHPAYNFIITRPNGTEVWRHTIGILDIMLSTPVLPGEELNFTAEWDQRELRWDEHHSPVKGDLVPPGTYWVQGIFHGNLFEKVYAGGAEELKTKPKRLVIKPSGGV